MRDIPISSSDIRNMIQSGEGITGLVPDYIRDYIIDKRLYLGE
jgi:nicotinic acid mononucleotide adenylyltransferase